MFCSKGFHIMHVVCTDLLCVVLDYYLLNSQIKGVTHKIAQQETDG